MSSTSDELCSTTTDGTGLHRGSASTDSTMTACGPSCGHRAVIAATPDVVHVYDVAAGSLSRVIDSERAVRGFSPEGIAVISGRRTDELVPAADRLALRNALAAARALPDGESESVRHRVVRADGEVVWLCRRIAPLERGDDGLARTLVVVSTDVTDVVAVEQRLQFAATHDELTGLPNRRRFLDVLARTLTDGYGVAVVLINLNGFKPVNDLYGRDAGDAVLSAVARRLASAVRAGDVVARIGGDEFGLLISAGGRETGLPVGEVDLTTEMHIDGVVRRVASLLAEPFVLADAEISLSAGAGICMARHDLDAEAMLSAAGAAMDHVKRTGASGHYVYDAALDSELRALEHIERTLRRALRDDTLEVHYQPIVAPATGEVRSVEALVRLRDGSGSLLPVEQVIAVAERCSLVAELDDQMLRKACRQVAIWRLDPAHADLRLTLNRSAKDLNRAGFHDRIMASLVASDLPADALTLEITETVLLDVTSARVEEMMRLRESFVSLAIDDFGTGYASMSQLVSLPISAIKIDRSFTARMLDDPTCAALVRASVRIAADLGMSCVVEGVETIEQVEALPAYERLLVQGYLYARPRPSEDGLGVTRIATGPRLRPFEA